MRQPSTMTAVSPRERQPGNRAGARAILLVAVGILAGLVAGAYLLYHARRGQSADRGAEAQDAIVLSDGTKAVLERLDSPVEIRFYALLDPASASDALKLFAERVDGLVSQYQREAGGKIKVSHLNAKTGSAEAASADGLQPFNLDKGEACYLGIAVAQGGQKETLPRLAPEWEAALEPDLSRAIDRVAHAKPATKSAPAAPRIDAAAMEAVKLAIPNFATVSLNEGTKLLRTAALAEFRKAAAEMESQVKEAQERLSKAQDGGSQTEQEAAKKHLQDVQAEQGDKLKEIAARSQAQIEALEQLKKDAR